MNSFNCHRILTICSFIILILIILHIITLNSPTYIHQKFDLNSEANLPTWFSTILLFSVACLTFIIFRYSVLQSQKTFVQTFWVILSVIFCFLSFDEAAKIHEIIDESLPIKWVFIYLPFALVLLIFIIYYFTYFDKDKKIYNYILGGMFTYAIGGMGCEFLSTILYPLPFILQQTEIIFEEGFEMFGTTLLIIGCIKELIKYVF